MTAVHPISSELADSLKGAMRQVVSAVTIVSAGSESEPIGMTATAVSMVSLAPPSLLVCVNRSARLHQALCETGRFRIAFIGPTHRELARAFGGGLPQTERFTAGDWILGASYGPQLVDAVIDIGCDLQTQLDHGSHTIFVGGVMTLRAGDGPVLLYGDGDYRRAA